MNTLMEITVTVLFMLGLYISIRMMVYLFITKTEESTVTHIGSWVVTIIWDLFYYLTH